MEKGRYKGYSYAFGAFEIKKEYKGGYLPVKLSVVAGSRHVLASIRTAIDAFSAGRSVARDILIEFLVRLTGTRQISKALEARGKRGKLLLVWIGKGTPPSPPSAKELPIPSKKNELDAIEKRLLIQV